MAAMLIEIKSRMLLPARKTQDGKEAEDPRAELVRRLLEYEQIKLAAADSTRCRCSAATSCACRCFSRARRAGCRWSTPDDLRQAWADISRRATLKAHHHITREQLSVREHMSICCAACRAAASSSSTTCSTRGRRAGDRGPLHRAARAGARNPARSDAGRGVRADLCAAGVSAELRVESATQSGQSLST